jgi:hypothetical protein
MHSFSGHNAQHSMERHDATLVNCCHTAAVLLLLLSGCCCKASIA